MIRLSGEITALTGLRAIAALAVFLHHFSDILSDLFDETSFEGLRLGYLGVDIFFVLSGFILSYNYAGRIRSPAEYRVFLGNRLARIYPLHIATLLAMLVGVQGATALDLQIRSPENHTIDYHLLLHLTLTQAWGFEEALRYNLPSWSISAEFFAYLLFPIFWAVSSRGGRRSSLALAVASAGATAIVLRILGHPSLHVPCEHALVRVTGEFMAGCLAFRAFSLRSPDSGRGTRWEPLILLGLAGLILSPWADPGMAIGAVALVYVLAVGKSPWVAALGSPPVAWLGRISYAIYLVHMPVLSALQRVLPAADFDERATPVKAGVVALYVGAVILTAATSFYLVERPARRWLRRSVRMHSAPASPAPGAT